MCESATQRLQIDEQIRLRNLAMQLAVELRPHCFNKHEALEVVRCLNELIEWEYQGSQPALKVVG